MQNVLFAMDDDRMARIVSSLIAGDNIEAICQEVNDLAFAFVAPLGAYDYQICHDKRFQASDCRLCMRLAVFTARHFLHTKHTGNMHPGANANGCFKLKLLENPLPDYR